MGRGHQQRASNSSLQSSANAQADKQWFDFVETKLLKGRSNYVDELVTEAIADNLIDRGAGYVKGECARLLCTLKDCHSTLSDHSQSCLGLSRSFAATFWFVSESSVCRFTTGVWL